MIHRFVQCRYGPDDPDHYGLAEALRSEPPHGDAFYRHLLSTAVRITPELFPQLHNSLSGVNKAIGLEREVHSFVVADPNMQAYCCSHQSQGEATFTIILSSGLVEKLTPEELRFVIGHEVGHFLCEHWRYPSQEAFETPGEKLAALQLHRSAEISADRIGLLTADSIEAACSAMIKTAAGLGAPHLRPDISSMLSQFRELSGRQGHSDSIWVTHPIIPLRIRALLRFDNVALKLRSGNEVATETIEAADAAIARDFGKSSGFALEKLDDDHLAKARMWSIVATFAADGVLSKWEQQMLAEMLGEELSAQVMNFLKDVIGDVSEVTLQKALGACRDAQNAPAMKRRQIFQDLQMLIQAAEAERTHGAKVLDQVRQSLGL